MEVSDVLRGAAEYIAEHGKHNGSYGEPGGPRCVMGAISSVLDKPFGVPETPAYHLLRRLVVGQDFSVGTWSDNNTEDGVILGLLMAAEYAKDEEAGNG